MNTQTFGLDIGASSMKAVVLSKASDGFLLGACSSAATPLKGMSSEAVLDQEEMAQAIKRLVTDAHITATRVHIALPENQVYTRVIEMPPLSDKELSSAIFWEAEQYIPVPLATITFDYTVLKRPADNEQNGKMQVLLVGAPTTLIDKYDKVLSFAGLSIVSVETEILSTIRSLIHPATDQNVFPASIIVNIGALTTSLAIVKDNIVVFAYSFPLGGTSISRAIATDFGFSVAQAEEYKKVYGVTDKTFGGKIGKASEPILLSMLAEVKKALTFYAEKYKDNEPIRQIILSGGTAKLPGIDVFFAKSSGVETVIANPWKSLAPSQQIPQVILDNSSDYTIAVGLAMKE